MAIVRSAPRRGRALLGYGARVAFAAAIIMIGLTIGVKHWPCDIARIAGCPAFVRQASAPPASHKKVAVLKAGRSGPLPAIAEKLAAAAAARRLGAEMAGIAGRTDQAPGAP